MKSRKITGCTPTFGLIAVGSIFIAPSPFTLGMHPLHFPQIYGILLESRKFCVKLRDTCLLRRLSYTGVVWKCYTCTVCIVNILPEQSCPKYSPWHVHVYAFPLFSHVPPFLQGLLAHGSISIKKKSLCYCSIQIQRFFLNKNFFFKKKEDISPFCRTPVSDFWWGRPWVSKSGWILCSCAS